MDKYTNKYARAYMDHVSPRMLSALGTSQALKVLDEYRKTQHGWFSDLYCNRPELRRVMRQVLKQLHIKVK